MYYRFVGIRKTLRVTPAMAAGVSNRLWELAGIAKLVEDAEAKPAWTVQEAENLSFFWFLALMQAVYVAYIWFIGRIRLRGWLVIDRDVEPRRFRLFLIGFAVSVPILILQAVYPPYSN